MDEVVPPAQSALLYDRLVSAGVPARLVMVSNCGHILVPVGAAMAPSRAELATMVADFFDTYLK